MSNYSPNAVERSSPNPDPKPISEALSPSPFTNSFTLNSNPNTNAKDPRQILIQDNLDLLPFLSSAIYDYDIKIKNEVGVFRFKSVDNKQSTCRGEEDVKEDRDKGFYIQELTITRPGGKPNPLLRSQLIILYNHSHNTICKDEQDLKRLDATIARIGVLRKDPVFFANCKPEESKHGFGEKLDKWKILVEGRIQCAQMISERKAFQDHLKKGLLHLQTLETTSTPPPILKSSKPFLLPASLPERILYDGKIHPISRPLLLPPAPSYEVYTTTDYLIRLVSLFVTYEKRGEPLVLKRAWAIVHVEEENVASEMLRAQVVHLSHSQAGLEEETDIRNGSDGVDDNSEVDLTKPRSLSNQIEDLAAAIVAKFSLATSQEKKETLLVGAEIAGEETKTKDKGKAKEMGFQNPDDSEDDSTKSYTNCLEPCTPDLSIDNSSTTKTSTTISTPETISTAPIQTPKTPQFDIFPEPELETESSVASSSTFQKRKTAENQTGYDVIDYLHSQSKSQSYQDTSPPTPPGEESRTAGPWRRRWVDDTWLSAWTEEDEMLREKLKKVNEE